MDRFIRFTRRKSADRCSLGDSFCCALAPRSCAWCPVGWGGFCRSLLWLTWMSRLEHSWVYKGPPQATSLSRCDHPLIQKNHGSRARFTWGRSGGTDWSVSGKRNSCRQLLIFRRSYLGVGGLEVPVWCSGSETLNNSTEKRKWDVCWAPSRVSKKNIVEHWDFVFLQKCQHAGEKRAR